jgi:hypothetical protein
MARGAARDLQKEAAWRRRLSRHAESGQSVRAWCGKHRVTETAFYWWRKELARRDAERLPSGQRDTKGRAAAFVPVHVTAEAGRDGDQEHGGGRDGGAQIEIVLTDGRCVRLTCPVNGQALAEVLDVLEHRAC